MGPDWQMRPAVVTSNPPPKAPEPEAEFFEFDDPPGPSETTAKTNDDVPEFLDMDWDEPAPPPPPIDDPGTVAAKQLLKMLDDKWESLAPGEELKFAWTEAETEQLRRLIKPMCTRCQEILKKDAYPVLHLQSPIFVLGDLHGRFDDLHFFLRNFYSEEAPPLAKESPVNTRDYRIAGNLLLLGDGDDYQVTSIDAIPEVLSASSAALMDLKRKGSSWAFGPSALRSRQLLFLGDFVDRGFASTEVVLYVMALKVISPAKIHLIRGNHELEFINYDYGFNGHCKELFGRQGDELWWRINQVFNFLPLAAILDDQVFCAHGGVPRPGPGGEEDRKALLGRTGDWVAIRDNPNQWQWLQEKGNERFKTMFDDLLWTDPAPDGAELDAQGFGPSCRGISVSYGAASIDAFLQAMGLSLILRAHELKARGFNVCKSGKVVTVFSASFYEGNDNAAGAVFIANGTLRAITRKGARP
eukprot:TRINITY_DN12712_c0_g1_i1.p1 TRINITY_DN12712_c0_g1~~TRINITY_DN12712_c0_g1_i1.p1  ORF type:complete len:471 (+),score=153.46 TRINITY_DN12712_c0_g1_i1:135-1547(+)